MPQNKTNPLQKRSTKLEIEEQIEKGIEFLSQFPYGISVSKMMLEFDMGRSTAVHYVRLSREKMLAGLETTREAERSKAYYELQSIIQNPLSTQADRCKAITTKMNLLGLRAPIQVTVNPHYQTELDPLFQRNILTSPNLLTLSQKIDEELLHPTLPKEVTKEVSSSN